MTSIIAMSTFVEVAKAGSFAAAARKLGLSTSAVSRHVAELEKSLGVTLLRRTTRKVSPTQLGRQYLPRAAAILQEIEHLNSETAATDQVPRGKLKITAPPGVGADWIAPLVVDFVEKYPEIELELELTGRIVDLVGEGFDVAIRSGPLTDSSLISHRIVESSYKLCASPEFFARHGIPKTPEEITNLDCIHWQEEKTAGGWKFIKNGETTTVPVHFRLLLTGLAAHRDAARRGIGLAILPIHSIQDDLKSGRLVAVLEDYECYRGILSLVRPRTPFEPVKLRVFIDFITDALRRGEKLSEII